MSAADINALFSHAEAAFARGDLQASRADLIALEKRIGAHAAVLHLRGLVEKRSGALPVARTALSHAHRLEPGNAQIANNLANLLGEMGRWDDALGIYRQAIASAPDWPDPQINHAIALHRLARFDASRAAFHGMAAPARALARYWSALGALERDAGDLDAAVLAYDRALEIEATHPAAARARARLALERGDDQAAERYRELNARFPDDLDVTLNYAEALESAGAPEGIDVLAGALHVHPGWIEGHQRLAAMRSEAGEDDICRSYREALQARPLERALWLGQASALAKAFRYDEALDILTAARRVIEEDHDLLIVEAVCADEAGHTARASALFARLGDSGDADVVRARARHALRVEEINRAATLFQRLVDNPATESIFDWAHLGLAWRALSDPRHEWLNLQPGLHDALELGLTDDELNLLAETLRSLHRTHAQPMGQSLRGGTQTRGRLFARSEPALAMLRERISTAIARFREGLPPADPRHPLLRMRDRPFGLDGSWSVRLQGSGFHVSHIHPRGTLSSACYVSLPASLGRADSRDGWLELGAAPEGLNLSLSPIATIQPRPGLLALFPSYMFHGTRPFESGERLTVAFDIVAR